MRVEISLIVDRRECCCSSCFDSHCYDHSMYAVFSEFKYTGSLQTACAEPIFREILNGQDSCNPFLNHDSHSMSSIASNLQEKQTIGA